MWNPSRNQTSVANRSKDQTVEIIFIILDATKLLLNESRLSSVTWQEADF